MQSVPANVEFPINWWQWLLLALWGSLTCRCNSIRRLQLLFLHSCRRQVCMQSHLGTINLFLLCCSNQPACPAAADTVNRTAALTTSGVAFYVIPLLLFDSNWIRSSIGTYLLGSMALGHPSNSAAAKLGGPQAATGSV